MWLASFRGQVNIGQVAAQQTYHDKMAVGPVNAGSLPDVLEQCSVNPLHLQKLYLLMTPAPPAVHGQTQFNHIERPILNRTPAAANPPIFLWLHNDVPSIWPSQHSRKYVVQKYSSQFISTFYINLSLEELCPDSNLKNILIWTLTMLTLTPWHRHGSNWTNLIPSL